MSLVGTMAGGISMRGVYKYYGSSPALVNMNMDIPELGRYALIGPNGAGKSTTLKLLIGLLKPDSGQIQISGFEPGSMEARRMTGYLPEDAAPYGTLSVRENMEYMAALRGIERPADRVEELLDLLSLREFEHYKISKLSRGNRQKLSIGLAVIHRPRVVLLDEPLNYLDIPTQEKVVSLLEAMDATFLVSTHIMSIAKRLTDSAVIISRGRNIWTGNIRELEQMASGDETIETVIVKLIADDAQTV